MDQHTQLRIRKITRTRLNAIKAQVQARDGERITTDEFLTRLLDKEMAANPGMAERVSMAVQLVQPKGAAR
ncbi:MAG: hypothetical protein KAZ26_19960 [Caldilineaceae bacterium]|nr:hypothetical protein [Caldilineaceae bacterium]